ncbi:MAG TPA: DEAD/DEAH box helicase [Roseiflexaceae bacterium]|nr:DEAD/DEAH box helicase [Roseiflexaceae bacterium]
MTSNLRLADLLARGDAALAPAGALLAQGLARLDCAGVPALMPAQLDTLFGALPRGWGFADIAEVLDVATLSPGVAEQLTAWVEARLRPPGPSAPQPEPAPQPDPVRGGGLHPIVALERVTEEYRSYLLTEFRAKDPALKAALEQALGEPRFLAQDPFYQAHRPFRTGRRWDELGLDPRLAEVMRARSGGERAYRHQSEAIRTLLAPDPAPLVVTTGTGSGKTESFLLPVIQNALADVAAFNTPGLTAILIYPMNALANDQYERISAYLEQAGQRGVVSVAQYDRSTSQQRRRELRERPPHILLTNYMMLEYLLVRPADRDAIFAEHRCRFLVLDEVHTYRGTLGSNIALLTRRLRAHLARAPQSRLLDPPEQLRARRFPALVPVGTSATIKSIADERLPPEERRRLRDEAVCEFFGKLTGASPEAVRVLGEELEEISVPPEAAYPPEPVPPGPIDTGDREVLRQALCRLAGQPPRQSLDGAARHCRLLWDLNRWLVQRPLSLEQIAARVRAEVPARAAAPDGALRDEVAAALAVGAALPDGTPGALRLRVHRLVRGGWQFHRCVNPGCGRLYPMGEAACAACGCATAPLYLCRGCGAHYLRFVSAEPHDPASGPLRPSALPGNEAEWMLYEPARFPDSLGDAEEPEGEAEPRGGRMGNRKGRGQLKGRRVLEGSFDPQTLLFSHSPRDFPLAVTLSPARTRCLCCGATMGSRNVLTPVGLGTSAAVKVLAEGMVEALADAHRGDPAHDRKERLLVFSDSRQDAAHQARFITFAGRYDRMRRRVVELLRERGPLGVQDLVQELGQRALAARDTPHQPGGVFPTEDELARVRAYEEAPLLDDLALNAGYRATLINLGLVRVGYDRLDAYVAAHGAPLAEQLGLRAGAVPTAIALEHLCRCVLDEIRVRGCLSRTMLRYHPQHPSCPAWVRAAEWERQVKRPAGYPLDASGAVVTNRDQSELPAGVRLMNAWRRSGVGGRSPSLERILILLCNAFGGRVPAEADMVALLTFLKEGGFLVAAELHGAREQARLLQVNAETLRLHQARDDERARCRICALPLAGVQLGLPCPRCGGQLAPWPAEALAANRTVQRILARDITPLVAAEHTAQVTTEARAEIERRFKGGLADSPLNLLACSPTLEMGIDVGGLDAVILRNVPPRPDNYAQRGGRAGRRTRVGLVLGYARSTPHDQYFYDQPAEMIAGEVPAPALSLGNRDVILRHLSAIAFGAAEPGVAGAMLAYINPQGEIDQPEVDALIAGVVSRRDHALELARNAWGDDILPAAGLAEDDLRAFLDALPARIQDVVERTARQVIELRRTIERFHVDLERGREVLRAADLIRRLLGAGRGDDSDDRSSGYPLRRFAEFGLLPGYEFPSEPAALRLHGDAGEDDPIAVARRFGLAQFQPEATVYARGGRWRVAGLDPASPWNPRSDGPGWLYRRCRRCNLRFHADEPACPRCGDADLPQHLPAAEYAGFLALRDDHPILDEEERYAMSNRVAGYPQWNGDVVGRWTAGPGWGLRLSRDEEVRWLNEGPPPSAAELEAPDGTARQTYLSPDAAGYRLCPRCGRMLAAPEPTETGSGRRRPRAASAGRDPYNHAPGCPDAGRPPLPVALVTSGRAELLRLLAPAPERADADDLLCWGMTLGYALRLGMRHRYMLDGPEIEFLLEGPWPATQAGQRYQQIALCFVDPSVGGSGYLRRIAQEFHLVAQRAIAHLDHPGCASACYRCLKSYENQRFHELLRWPRVIADLRTLAERPPEQRRLERGDIDDPRPWLDAYAAGVGSPLELRFLRLFEAHGFHPQRQVPVGPAGAPAISVADFAVPERRLAIYVDGAAFHQGAARARDLNLRARLRAGDPPWTVVELRAADLGRGAALVKELLRTA